MKLQYDFVLSTGLQARCLLFLGGNRTNVSHDTMSYVIIPDLVPDSVYDTSATGTAGRIRFGFGEGRKTRNRSTELARRLETRPIANEGVE